MTPVVTEPMDSVICPLCRTQAPELTGRALAAGTDWSCPHCHQMWNAARLETVAAYAAYCAQRSAS